MIPATAKRATVVTASDRLARHLHERAADAELAAGRRAWERPDILPVGAFWRRLAIELEQEDTALAARRVLSRAAVSCRFEMLVAETFADMPLLQTAGAARSALDAWLLCRDWQLDIDALAGDPLEETRLMIGWGRRFEQECAERGWLPEYALPEAVLGALERAGAAHEYLPASIRLAGFMEIAPRDETRWNALRALGADVERAVSSHAPGDARRLACSDARAENAAVAAWARSQLLAHAGKVAPRIGIVVPDLGARRAALRRELTDALAPSTLAGFDASPLPFNFSLGEPLAACALVADALALLSLTGYRIEFTTAARLCRSPYLGPGSELTARWRLEAVMRREGFAEFTLTDWQRLAAREHCGALALALESLRAEIGAAPSVAQPSEWARHFSRWLETLGWCRGRALDSNEYQAREAWNAQLARLVELDPVLGRCSRGDALAWLNRFANETLFQPRAADAPVQVLGLLEATGMQFDALWVTGLTDDVLPAAPRPNPFLPVAVQRAKHLPQSSAVRELAFARELFEGLRNAAPEIVASYPLREGDADLAPSPLLNGLPDAHPVSAFPPVASQWFDNTRLETRVDDHGPPHADDGEDGRTHGGTALLLDQSHCPFRAFAIHRLGAQDWPTPQPGPDARIRGQLAHRVLERLWQAWRTRATLERLRDDGELERAIGDAVDAALAESLRSQRHRWRDSLRELERARLVNVMLRWFGNVELQRPEFTVAEVEGVRADGSSAHTLVHAGPLTLRGKLDRVDVLRDGSEIIIDYKTGSAPAKNDFFGDRPRAPQLPAYVVARRQAGLPVAAGIAVASLRTGRESLQGVMRFADGDGNGDSDPGIAGMVNVAKTKRVNDWDEAVTHWEHAIAALGEGFAAGEARVDPLRGACDYCHLATLCRIHEQSRERVEDSDD